MSGLFSKAAMNCAARYRARRFLWAATVATVCPVSAAHAQEAPEQRSNVPEAVEEIIVSVDRQGRPVDFNALRLEEARLETIRTFEVHQIKVQEEQWRLKLRSIAQRKNSRITWGYDAQTEAARVAISQAIYLPINRVRPATVVSFRF